MSCSEFVDKLNSIEYPEYKGVSWKDTFNSQITEITKSVLQKMQETIEHSNQNFELFGFDFVIDNNLKCWLIEANMSPAIANRKN